MLEVIDRMDGYTTGKNNGVLDPDHDALNRFFSLFLEHGNRMKPESYINCLSYMTCYSKLPEDLRKDISRCEIDAYTSLTQARQYNGEESQKRR